MDEVSEEECFSNVIVNIKHEKEDEEENLEEESHEFTGIDVNLVKCELKEEIPDSHDNNINKINEEPTNFVYVNVKEEREDISEEAEEFCNCTANVEEFNADVKDTLLKSLEVSKSSSDDSERPDSTKDVWSETHCTFCKRRKKFIYGKHFIIDAYEDIYKCQICDEKFYDKFNFSQHMPRHSQNYITKRKQFECEICKKLFTNKFNLARHLLIHTCEIRFTCLICNKEFINKDLLSRHVVIHDEETQYRCHVCNKSFKRKHHLDSHTFIHTGIRDHKCGICNKHFIRKYDLNRHILSHGGEKSFKCEICDRSFMMRTNLFQHLITHTNLKPHTCDICGKSFARNSDLTRHKKSHTGNKDYECAICRKRFTSKSYLRDHKVLHETGRLCKCEVCNEYFTLKSYQYHINSCLPSFIVREDLESENS